MTEIKHETKTNASRHTPGPWVTDGGTHVQTLYTPTDGGKEFYYTIARTDQALVHPAQQGANARLIAAAPKLLAALENIVIGIGMGWDLEGMVGAANAAIAAATDDLIGRVV